MATNKSMLIRAALTGDSGLRVNAVRALRQSQARVYERVGYNGVPDAKELTEFAKSRFLIDIIDSIKPDVDNTWEEALTAAVFRCHNRLETIANPAEPKIAYQAAQDACEVSVITAFLKFANAFI